MRSLPLQSSLRPQKIILAILLMSIGPVATGDPGGLTPEILDHGASIIRLAAVAADTPSSSTGNAYVDLAGKLRHEMASARAVGAVAATNANLISTALTTYAVASPEPVTKVVAAAGAWAAMKQGEFIADTVAARTAETSVKVLKKFLDEQQGNVSAEQLSRMSASEFLTYTKTLKIGNQTLSEAVVDIPGGQAAIDAAAEDFIARKDAAQFLKIDAVKESVADLKNQMKANADAIGKLENMAADTNHKLSELKKTTEQLREDVQGLKAEVAGNTESIHGLIEVSSMSWTPQQKLAAVQQGLFKDITGDDRDRFVAMLQKEIRRDQLIGELGTRGRQIGQLAGIATGLGVDDSVVKALYDGQQVANAAVAFVSGDYLAAASVVVSMFGGSRKDPAAQQHAQMMKYLEKQFERVNVKLDEIKKLQEETLQQTIALRHDVLDLRREMERSFRKIEDQLNFNATLLKKIIEKDWGACDYLDSVLGGRKTVRSTTELKHLFSIHVSDRIGECYKTVNDSFNSWTNPNKWGATLVDFNTFSASVTSTDPEHIQAEKRMAEAAKQVYDRTREFVLVAMPKDDVTRELSRIAFPALLARHSEALQSNPIAVHKVSCAQYPWQMTAFQRIACIRVGTDADTPDPSGLSETLSKTLIGPLAGVTVDSGLLMSELVDLILKRDTGALRFPSVDDIDNLAKGVLSGSGLLRIRQEKGLYLLRTLDIFTLNWLVQQSATFGDYPAQLALEVLYDHQGGALITRVPDADSVDADRRIKIALALQALKENPILARNVVHMAIRKALLRRHNSSGIVQYQNGWSSLQNASACHGSGHDAYFMNQWFQPLPGGQKDAVWMFKHIVTPEEAENGGAYVGCPTDESDGHRAGTGIAVQFDGFHVRVPHPQQFDRGDLELAPSLRQAIIYRNKVSQALVARNLRTISGSTMQPEQLLQLYQ